MANYLDGIKPEEPEVEEEAEVGIGDLLDGKSKRFGQMAKAMFKGKRWQKQKRESR